MTIRVLGVGFGRTGTTSLKAALEELGFGPCYHMQEVFKNPSHTYFWLEASEQWQRQEPVGEWEQVFAEYQATVDWPACSFYPELLAAYPDAKILLSVRDPERWYASTRDSIFLGRSSLFMRILRTLAPHIDRAYRMVENLIWQGTFNDQFEDRTFAIGRFNQHNEAVQAMVSPERLLVYEVQEGWEPLCTFLNAPIPNKPFPHLNDKILMQRAIRYGPALLIGIVVSLVTAAVWLVQYLL